MFENTTIINLPFKKRFLRFSNLKTFFFNKFLLQSINTGKKKKFFNFFFKTYYFFLFFNFFKNNQQTIYSPMNFFLKKIITSTPINDSIQFFLNTNQKFWTLNYTLLNFSSVNQFLVSFSIKKKKSFVNHKKKFFDFISVFLVKKNTHDFVYFKFLKFFYLKKNTKKKILFLINNEFFNYSESSLKLVFRKLVFDQLIERKNN